MLDLPRTDALNHLQRGVNGLTARSPGQIYHRPTSSYPNLFGTTTPYKILVYTPTVSLSAGYTAAGTTYTPVDSDPKFDSNDQLSYLGNDTGADRSPTPPVNTTTSTPRAAAAIAATAPANRCR